MQGVEGKKIERKWSEETEALEIDELSGFVNGIKRDIDAVKNAIRFDYNNRLAEGSVNKMKVVKRIMYGCYSFELLKGKLLRLILVTMLLLVLMLMLRTLIFLIIL